MNYVVHSINPVYNHNSKILILGSLPSKKSREAGFYYSHSQNRFWKVMEIIFNEEIPSDISSRIGFLLKNRIAMWDVVSECTIQGSADASIKKVIVNDFSQIFMTANISAIFLTGKTAYNLYKKYCSNNYNEPYYLLPSTSSANCAVSIDRLAAEYSVINNHTIIPEHL